MQKTTLSILKPCFTLIVLKNFVRLCAKASNFTVTFNASGLILHSYAVFQCKRQSEFAF